jgi:hypothetical protein
MDELNGVAPKGSGGGGEKIVQELLKNMLRSITEAVELTGYINPMNKVYALHKQLDQLPLCFTLLTIYSYDQLYFSAFTSSLMQRNEKSLLKLDGPAIITGMITIFKQFHPSNQRVYVQLICHYFKNELFRQMKDGTQPAEITRNASMTLAYLDEMIRFEGSSREAIS